MMDYRKEYTDYWSRGGRFGTHSFADPRPIAAQIMQSCGIGSVLDVGSGMGLLVQTLLREGIDARGVDVAQRVVDTCNTRMPGRFTQGSILELPFADGSFDTVISTDCLQRIAPTDIPAALAELKRVCRRSLFLRVAAKADRDTPLQLTIQNRDWWEPRLFEIGFRKHSRYYYALSYEELEREPEEITIVLEKLPADAATRYPLRLLAAQRNLHMDMLRETGRRSDAYVVRYQLAAKLIRPGDRVLDAACGLGYGAYVMRQNSLAREVLGIDISESAVEYAQINFASADIGVKFDRGDLPTSLEQLPANSFDLVASFETLEHIADPDALLSAFHRILKPGGRVVLSVPNDWTDETGKDPNPYHLQVYTWDRILKEFSSRFIVDTAWQQIASGCRVAADGGRWKTGPRRLRQFDPNCSPSPDSEWCILTGIKSPRKESIDVSYAETVFANVATAQSPVGQYTQSYQNPWLVHAMVHIGYRLRSPSQLGVLAWRVLEEYPSTTADVGAALCIVAYRAFEQIDLTAQEAERIAARVSEYLKNDPSNPHVLRWQISLTFVMARIWLEVGEIDRGIEWFLRCAAMDSLAFSPHLATKTTEAFYEAGRLNLRQKRDREAERIWTEGLAFGRRLLAVPLDAVLVNPAYPNLFDHGDGMREFTLALDFLTRCANGLHLLQRQREGYNVDWQALDRSFRWLAATLQENLTTAQMTVGKLNTELDVTRTDLISRTRELDAARAGLTSRTAELDRDREELRQRNLEVNVERNELIDRTKEVTAVRKDLIYRTAELDAARQELVDRTGELNMARRDLADRTLEVDTARQDLIDRTVELDTARKDLIDRTVEVDAARKDLIDRTIELDEARAQSKAKKRFRKR